MRDKRRKNGHMAFVVGYFHGAWLILAFSKSYFYLLAGGLRRKENLKALKFKTVYGLFQGF